MKRIGIIGGLGPRAHVDFEQKLIEIMEERGVKRDQDYAPWKLISIPQTPDRTLAMEGESEQKKEVLDNLLKAAGELEDTDFIVIVCNTAHGWYGELQARIQTPILHLMEVVADYIKVNFHQRKVGLLATRGTVKKGLYQRELEERGIEYVVPDDAHQQMVMDAIYNPEYGIKKKGRTPQAVKLLKQAADHLIQGGVELIVEGCTEIPIALDQADVSATLVDANYVLASRAVEGAYN